MAVISVIFPTYNEQDNLRELVSQMRAVTSRLKDEEFEFLFIDDCSADRTPEVLKELHISDKRVKSVRFARNCGSHAAIAAGLAQCSGDCAVIMAADLQDPPELIISLVSQWRHGAKVVWGVRTKRLGEKFTTKFFSRVYYTLMNYFTTVRVPPLGADVFLADRAVIEAFKGVSEKHTSVFMLLAWLGFRQESVPYVKQPRFKGKSKWTLGQKIKLTIDSLLAFSDIFIRYMSVLGVVTAFLGFLYAVPVLWRLVNGIPVGGWSLLIIAILIVGGVQMVMLGILGEYLWRTFDESRKRPRYVVEYSVGMEERFRGIKL